MTSEVALLNRSAVALAADSATTVRAWEGDKYVTRYFKGTNKIFHISANHPVGMMIYAAAGLQGVPWDTLIKSYRDQLGDHAHDHLHEYASNFFEYIEKNSHIFSTQQKEQQFKVDVDIVAARIVTAIASVDSYKNATNLQDRINAAKVTIGIIRDTIIKDGFVGNADQNDIDSSISKYKTEIFNMISSDTFYDQYKNIVDFNELTEVAIIGQHRISHTNLNYTGIVITGFGGHDFFPQLVTYSCYGFIPGKLLISEEKTKKHSISQNNTAAFVTFAQDEMIRNFIFGISGGSLEELKSQFSKGSDGLCDALLKEGFLSDVSADPGKSAKLDQLKSDALKGFMDRVINYTIQSHSQPMRRVLGSLPFDELAELAETLVLLESLKERVTTPSSSVSGPIDVAVISKNDGFIWIKRKHYFDSKLNPRYFSKHNRSGGHT